MSVLTGLCPDLACKTRLYFPLDDDNSKIMCTNCGQTHDKKYLLEVVSVTNLTYPVIQSVLESIFAKSIPKRLGRTIDSMKVKGLSNYCCKLISPLLTKYGFDRNTHEVKLLTTMGQGDIFDCTHLSDRAFNIEEKKLEIVGYGKDNSSEYLDSTLKEISKVNNHQECLVPIHADGDGHCLLHAVSRALVGHELFWHPLMTNLKSHLMQRQIDYKNLFQDFFEDSEWDKIIEEADPNFIPSNGETHGLCNIHIFGLANVLHRPIILLDSLEGILSKADYSAVFLPALVPSDECRDKHNNLHKPIVIAWSSRGRNHFIPLVGVKEKPLPKFPQHLLPKVWGLPQELLAEYIEFENNMCVIGGRKGISDEYLLKLVTAMEKHFQVLNGVTPSVVQDVYQFIMKPNDVINATTQVVIETARELATGERLYKCLECGAVMEVSDPCQKSWLEPGGRLYEVAIEAHGALKDGFYYRFPQHDNVLCSYSKDKDKLLFVQNINDIYCKHCQGSMRLYNRDGSIVYMNGDQLTTQSSENSKCGCGFKHYWDGKEYDNLPRKIPVCLEWNGRTVTDVVFWFRDEVDVTLNSNAYQLAATVVQKHFPSEFGSERLVESVVNQIFTVALAEKPEKKHESKEIVFSDELSSTPTKIILTGAKSKTLHKEELNVSQSERIVRNKIEQGAAVKQQKLSSFSNKTAIGKEVKKTINEEATVSKPPIESKIRISRANSRDNKLFIISKSTTYADLQCFITKNFDVPIQQLEIKYGFPPKLFEIPKVTSETLKLNHGERLVLHEKVIQVPSLLNKSVDTESTSAKDIIPSPTKNPIPEVEKSEIVSELFRFFKEYDLWNWACSERSFFQPDGLFYKQAFQDLGSLTDNQHFSLPCFPHKLFSFNKSQNEIFLCLGETHIPVQPLTENQLIISNQQRIIGSHTPADRNDSVKEEYLQKSSSFTTMQKLVKDNNPVAFTGIGRSMLDKSNDAENAEQQETVDEKQEQSMDVTLKDPTESKSYSCKQDENDDKMQF